MILGEYVVEESSQDRNKMKGNTFNDNVLRGHRKLKEYPMTKVKSTEVLCTNQNYDLTMSLLYQK